MNRLAFVLVGVPIDDKGKEEYSIYNQKEQFLGKLMKKRIGAYMHWCFFPDAVNEIGDLWFSPGCMDEIRAKMKELGGRK